MEHSNYHLYEAAIWNRDLAVLWAALMVLIPFLGLSALEHISQRALQVARWLLIGGYYVSLLALFVVL